MLSLTTTRRDEVLNRDRKGPDPGLRSRAHIALSRADGYARDTIEAMRSRRCRTVDRRRKRFRAEGIAGLTGRGRGRPPRLGVGRVAVLVYRVTAGVPPDFGPLRGRGSCVALARPRRRRPGVAVGRETVRRMSHRGNPVSRRPRPVPPPGEEGRRIRPAELRTLLEARPAGATAVFRGAVEVHTDPAIGPMGMSRAARRPCRRRARTRSGTWPGRCTGGPDRCSSPRRPPSEAAAAPCR